jgi:glycosyltransferase involved in cell wall biosynthesis
MARDKGQVAIDCRLMLYRKAGISNYTRRLVRELAAISHQQTTMSVLLDRRDRDTAWVPANVVIKRTFTPAHHPLEHIALPLELSFLHASFAILHSPDFVTCRGRFKKVITIHDLYFVEHPEAMHADGARYYARTRWSAQQAHAIIAVSEFTKRDILRLMPEIPASKIQVIHEAADTELRNTPTPHPSPLSPFPFAFALFVGTFEPRKNLPTLLRALAQTPPEIKLVIVGAAGWGSGDGEPAHLARQLNLQTRVHFAGRVSDAELDALYRAARLFVFPSLSEGFGLPVLEAMARGTPVICSDAGSLPEIVGDAAVRASPFDVDAWRASLARLWANPTERATLAQRGLARVQQFSWHTAARETLLVYKSLLTPV